MTARTPPDDDETEHHVAVVVFATVRARHESDARSFAEDAVTYALGEKVAGMRGARLPADIYNPDARTPYWADRPATVVTVRDLDVAARNGYLVLGPDPHVYRRYGRPAGE